MRLQDLPVDLLAQILVGEISIEAIGLWMTWNHQMMAKLANGGICELEIDTLTITADNKWPQFLKLWKLKSLRISRLEWHSTRSVGPQLRAELRQLWCGLESLEIEGKDVASAFKLQKSTSSTSCRKPARKKAKLLNSTTKVNDTGDWNMNTTHPHLTRLKLAALPRGNRKASLQLKFGSITFLPRSLTYLDVSKAYFTIDASECAHLPPQLETLILPPNAITHRNIGALPPSLTRVYTPNHQESCFTHEAILALARDEKEILPNLAVFPSDLSILMWYNIYHVAGDKWRSNIVEMSIYHGILTEEATLKNGFFVLTLPASWDVAWKKGSFFNAPTALWLSEELPKSLTKLSLESIDWKSDHSHPTWPATLTSFELKYGAFSSPNFSSLPRNLKELYVKTIGPSSSAADIPDLLLQGQTFLNTIDEQKWRELKLELQSDRDRELDDLQKTQFDEYIAEVEKGRLYGLPLTLERIVVRDGYPHSGDIPLYPPKLRITDSFFSLCSSALETLPPRSLTQLTIRVYLHDRIGPTHVLNSLKQSKSVKKFTLVHYQDSRCDYMLPWVPRDLFELSLDSHLIADIDLGKLPQHLRVLHIHRPPPNVAQLWADLMPKTLTVLHIPQWVLQGSDCSKMPPLLERLIVKVSNLFPFSMEQFEQLPSTLHHGLISQVDLEVERGKIFSPCPEPKEISWRLVRAFMALFLETLSSDASPTIKNEL